MAVSLEARPDGAEAAIAAACSLAPHTHHIAGKTVSRLGLAATRRRRYVPPTPTREPLDPCRPDAGVGLLDTSDAYAAGE
jgi:hypothetical protein